MRKSVKLVSVAAAAGAAIAVMGASSAFTDSNGGTTTSIAGYGAVSASGIDVTGVHYVQDSSDYSKVNSVAFETTTDVTVAPVTSTLVLSDGGSTISAPNTCAAPTGTSSPWTITCTFTAPESLSAFDSIALTVTNS